MAGRNSIPEGLLIEAASGGSGRRWTVRVIRAGISGNGNFYPDKLLRESAGKFDGARVFVKSDDEHLAGRGRDVRNLAGRLVKPEFVAGGVPDTGEIRAELELLEADGPVAAKLRAAWDGGMTDLFGLSIDATGRARAGRMQGRKVRIAESIEAVKSVDLIVEPAAGGQILNLIESQGATTVSKKAKKTETETDEGEDGLTPRQVRDLVEAADLPEAAERRLIEAHRDAEPTRDELRESIRKEREYLANFTESGKVQGLGSDDWPDIRTAGGQDCKAARMLEAFFDPEHKDHRHARSIRDIYLACTGDRGFTGQLGNCDRALLRESLGSGDWASVLGDSIARRMVPQYRAQGQYDVWRRVANIVPVQDFRTQERTRFGGYGDLPIVAQGAPYLAVTSPTDEKATYAVQKRGGTEDLTLEMITNDDVGSVRRIPTNLTRAAKRTLSKFVLDLIRTNPVIYDSIALFHASHGNLGSAALDAMTLAAGRLAMKNQTEKDSGDKLGIGPKSLLVADNLEETAVDLFRRNTENDKTFVQSLSLDVIPVWYWTDANDWALAADPMDIPSIEVGFLSGDEEPALFVQDSPTLGSMFTHDKITYKIRHIYGATVTDFRGLYKGIVP